MGFDTFQPIALGAKAFIFYHFLWFLDVFGATDFNSCQCERDTSTKQVGLVILAAGSEAKKRDRWKETRDQWHRIRHTANLSCRINTPLTNIPNTACIHTSQAWHIVEIYSNHRHRQQHPQSGKPVNYTPPSRLSKDGSGRPCARAEICAGMDTSHHE